MLDRKRAGHRYVARAARNKERKKERKTNKKKAAEQYSFENRSKKKKGKR